MGREISKKLVCIKIQDNVEIWVEEERVKGIIMALSDKNAPQFIQIENQIINKSYIVGIFDSKTMEETTRRKNGQWKCKYNTWHSKGEECHCAELQRYKTFKTYDKGFASIQKNS